MDEIRRQAYLTAMGIGTCFPRSPTQLALPPEIVTVARERAFAYKARPDIEDEEKQISTAVENKQSVDADLFPIGIGPKNVKPGKLNSSNQNNVAEPSEHSAELFEQQTVESQQQEDNIEPVELRFSLQFYCVNEQLAVINEIPYLDNNSADESLQILLLAILKSLGIELKYLEEPQVFRWPLAEDDNAGIERIPEALLTLGGFMRKRLESSDYSQLLIFAAQCRELLQSDQSDVRVFGDVDAQVTITHSLHAMLRVAALKKEVWQDIQILQGIFSHPIETYKGEY